jgi:putative heme-binding domain-containing protein
LIDSDRSKLVSFVLAGAPRPHHHWAMMERFLILLTLAVGLVPCLAQRNLDPSAIPEPDPKLQLESFQLAEGLEINLFASDPMIAKPIQMNWDARGRLWVVSSRLYPHIKPGERSDDQVIVLEDTDHDGAADKSTVFAENLLIPTGLMPGDGGLYVANSTEVLFLQDTDGDLKEDERTVLLSGFGTEDTHHIIHAFRGGPDGMLYFNQSIYIHSHVETPWGVRRLMAGGIWHFRPETRELEVFSRGFVNPWGHIFDRWGQSFATDGAFGEGINYVFPGSTWFTAYNAKRVMKGLNPGQPKHCGLEVISGRHFPDDWTGSLVTNDFRGHRVNRFVISENGSGYASRQVEDVVRTDHAAFRPIDVRVGPDGALYIADWYNPIIQHGEVDFRDPRRDHVHGRIWRVSYKGRPLVEKPKIADAEVETLLEYLKAPEDWTRHFAKRELRTRDQEEVVSAIRNWARKIDRENTDDAHELLEALWAFQSRNHLEAPLLRELLNHRDHRIRAAAVRVLYHWHDRLDRSLILLARAANESHPRVRLEAVNALRQVGTAKAIEAAFAALDHPLDANLDFALWLTARETKDVWLPAFQKGEINVGIASAVAFVLKATEDPAALKPLMEAFAKRKVRTGADQGEQLETIELIGDIGGPEETRFLFDHAMALTDSERLGEKAAAFRSLARAAGQRKVKPSGDGLEQLLDLVVENPDVNGYDVLGAAARLAGAWKLPGAVPKLKATASAARWTPAIVDATEALASIGGEDNIKTLIEIAKSGTSFQSQCAALAALATADLGQAASETASFLAGLEPGEPYFSGGRTPDGPMIPGVFRAFTFRKGGADALAGALNGVTIRPKDAAEGLRIAESSPNRSQRLIIALTEAGNLTPIIQGLSAEEMEAMINAVAKEGNALRGEAVYRRKQLLCATCHAIGGAGGVVGPDMISLGASAPVDYIIDSLLEPNKKIKEGYHMSMVTRKNGEIAAGAVVREDDNEVVLRDAAGKEIGVPTSDVASREVSPVSMMPAGLTATLRRDEFVDLVRFLSALGKEGGMRVSTKRLVRRWRAVDEHQPLSNAMRRQGLTDSILADPDLPWQPAYSRVDGMLPVEELGQNTGHSKTPLSIAMFELDVTAEGEISLKVNDTSGVQLRVGSTTIDLKDGRIALKPGRHEVIAVIERSQRNEPLSVELVDVEGSPAQVQIVGGL